MIKRLDLNFKFLTFLGLLFCATALFSQTPGMIYEPATGAGSAVLDPNGDGFTSASSTGFVSNDKAESELSFSPLIFPGTEPISDINNGPDCGFTDFVDSGSEDPALSYIDGSGNLIYRLRLGSSSSNAKSYSILLDTDGLFGNSGASADPDWTKDNPGFEIEIVLGTKKGVFIYDIGTTTPTCTPVTSYPGTTNYQKSIAHSTLCGGANYFLDFYVPFSELTTQFGITPSTTIRTAVVDNMAAGSSTICNPNSASDIGGVDASCGSLSACLTAVLDVQTPCTAAEIAAGTCLVKSNCPAITGPVIPGATVISGTSSEAVGTTITVYKFGVSVGTTTVLAGGAWNFTTAAVVANDEFKATAQASGGAVSDDDDCNFTIVGATCTPTPTATDCGKGIRGVAVDGAIIKVYLGNSTTPLPAAGGTIISGSTITAETAPYTLAAPNNFLWTCVAGPQTGCSAGGAPCMAFGAYRTTATSAGECESNPAWTCSKQNAGSPSTTATPTITTSPILAATTSIAGTVPAPANIAGVNVYLYANGRLLKGVLTTAGGAWTTTGLSIGTCDTIAAIAIDNVNSLCPSAYTADVIISGGTSTAPSITCPICGAPATTVSGTSGSGDGAVINVCDNGFFAGSTTVTSPEWTVNGVAATRTITTTDTDNSTCGSVSGISDGVLVQTQTSNL